MKAEVYVSLSTINTALETVTEHLEKLKAEGVLVPDLTELRQTMLEELRSEINSSATNALHTVELQSAYELQQQRLAQEIRLNPEKAEHAKPTEKGEK
jgi:hypothetical protein